MKQPPGFSDGTNRALRLLKSLYGLKQSALVWNEKLHAQIMKMGFEQCKTDPCLYTRKGKLGLEIICGRFVDCSQVYKMHPCHIG